MSDHADTIREALGGLTSTEWPADPEYYVKALAALDALVAERDEALRRAEGWVQHDTKAYHESALRSAQRAEAAEAERDEARRVILMVGAMLGQALTLTEYERVLVWLDSQPVARAALAAPTKDK